MIKALLIIKEFFLNMLLLSLVFVMIMLMYLNWTSGLDIDSMPEEFIAYDFVMSFRERVENSQNNQFEIKTQKLVIPYKVAIKNQENVYSALYDTTKCLNVFNNVFNNAFSNVSDSKSQVVVDKKSNIVEFLSVLNEEEFAYFEFFAPISAIINTDLDIYVEDMIVIIEGNDLALYIKSKNEFYKLIIKNTYASFAIIENLSKDYIFTTSNTGTINLISNISHSAYPLEISKNDIDIDKQQKIISTFLYNPAIVTNYQSALDEKVYVNEFSSITIAENIVEFESIDPRGNIIYEQVDLSKNQMIAFAMEIFNRIYTYAESSVVPHPTDFYYEDGQAVVVLSGKINGIDIDIDEPFGIFTFTSSGLSYCKINIINTNVTQEKISLIKTNLINSQKKLVLKYNLEGQVDWKEYLTKE